MWSLWIAAALATDPTYLRVSGGPGWVQGIHVGSLATEPAVVRGPGVPLTLGIGARGRHVAGGAELGAAVLPFLQVRGDALYPLRPTAAAMVGGHLAVDPGDEGGPLLYGSGGLRLPLLLVGRDHHAVIESFAGLAAGLGLGWESAPSGRGWSWGLLAHLDGLWGFSLVGDSGLSEAPWLALAIPGIRVTTSWGGRR
jgi:hypothetical protein